MLKSLILNVTIPQQLQTVMQTAFHFVSTRDHVTYLGVKISADLARFYSLNDQPLLSTVLVTLKSWSSRRHSWMGALCSA